MNSGHIEARSVDFVDLFSVTGSSYDSRLFSDDINGTNSSFLEDSVVGDNIRNGNVWSENIEAGALSNSHIKTGQVGTDNIADGSITTAKIESVAGIDIQDETLYTHHIGLQAIEESDLAGWTLGTNHIADHHVSSVNIIDNSLTRADFNTGSINNGKVRKGSIPLWKIKLPSSCENLQPVVWNQSLGQFTCQTDSSGSGNLEIAIGKLKFYVDAYCCHDGWNDGRYDPYDGSYYQMQQGPASAMTPIRDFQEFDDYNQQEDQNDNPPGMPWAGTWIGFACNNAEGWQVVDCFITDSQNLTIDEVRKTAKRPVDPMADGGKEDKDRYVYWDNEVRYDSAAHSCFSDIARRKAEHIKDRWAKMNWSVSFYAICGRTP